MANSVDFNTYAGKDAAPEPKLSDEALLDLVQKQTLKYFTDFAHPVSGMARERSNVCPEFGYDLDCVTTGGTGFGVMAIIAGAERGFVTKDEALQRITKIVDFLEGADKYHGAFSHFMNGNTGKTIPFLPLPLDPPTKDNGGDIVETSFLMMGLLSARQYFSRPPAAPEAAALCEKINKLWENVEWDWYTNGSDKLYWHWSPQYGFDMNMPIQGWNECLITHFLAASSPTHPVSPEVYEKCWTAGHDFRNGEAYAGIFGKDGKPESTITLPLGPVLGGPLFFSHYSFLGLNPAELKDQHADYWEQNRAHTLLNRAHCINNPGGFKGYGPECWGLTASDDHAGYSAHSPTNDDGAISPTAALSAFPYTPEYSMQALRHFHDDMKDKLWGRYGFTDAFNETKRWYADSFLAIDQGPIVVMIENHRSGLLWDLFMSCPEVKHGLELLHFESAEANKLPAAPALPKPRITASLTL